MKKFFVLLIAVLMFALAFTSCAKKQRDPETTTELMTKIDEKMESLQSYQSDVTANLATDIYGYRCVADFIGTQITIYGASDRFYYYNVMEGTTEMKDTEKNEVVETVKSKQIEAFHEGNMFVFSEQGDLKQNMYSPLTKDEYIAYLEKQESTLDIDFEACVNKAFAKNEDGTWTLTYSGYTKKSIATVVEAFQADELFEEEIVDMEITIHANADFTVKVVEFKMIFENESTTSEFRMKAEYSKYDVATPIVDTLDVSKYTQVADCRLLTDIADMIEDLEEMENGSFVLDLTQKLLASYSSTYTERDTVTYGKKDGKYFYDIKASTDTAKYDIAYANGKQSVTISGTTETADQTEKEAKEFINGLINSAKYNAGKVSNLQKKADGVYTITCDPDESLYQPVFASLGTSARNATQTITITIQDGKITKMESTVSANCYTTTYGSVAFYLTTECEFYY